MSRSHPSGLAGLTILAIAIAGMLCCLRGAEAAGSTVHAARVGLHGEVTRFVLEMNREMEGHLFYLQNPDRIVLDLPETAWDLGEDAGDPAGGFGGRGLIRAYRYGLFQPGTSRLVLDLAGPAVVERQFVLRPSDINPFHRLVLDIRPAATGDFAVAARETAPRVQRAALPVPPAVERRPSSRPVVVIDAGHGGVDPGAIGVSGLYEKDVTLAVALQAADLLRRTGRYEVHLTRDRDVFLQLRERVAIARAHQADLFVSVHADSVKNPSVRGAAVYTLSETASDAEAASLAAAENKADIIAGVDLVGETEDVASILIDLVQRDTKNRSAEMARYTVEEFRKHAGLRQRPHRFAGFRVLKAPDVPSVLIELGFMSNREDERMLRSKDGQARLARAVAAAVQSYLDRSREAAVR